MSSFDFNNLSEVLEKSLQGDELKEVKRIIFGRSDDKKIQLARETETIASQNDFEVRGYAFSAKPEDLRKPRIVRVAAVQNRIVAPTTEPIHVQRDALHARIATIVKAAAASDVNILCLQELWTMPYFFCTREKHPWCEFAEDAENGPTTKLIKKLARQHNMVIVSPILERDEQHGDTVWNVAVVISNTGAYLGKHRKNHIPRVEDFSESTYFYEGDTGHPVFETQFGRIAINICFGRHHPQNWMLFGLNGAEIVFNPSATVGSFSEPLWAAEAQTAAVANSYFAVAINRVGTEVFGNEFTSGDGRPGHKEMGPFFGSTFVAAPNGERTPALSRRADGLLIAEMDLNLCRQVRDEWSLRNTQRLPLYAEALAEVVKPGYKQQIVRENDH